MEESKSGRLARTRSFSTVWPAKLKSWVS